MSRALSLLLSLAALGAGLALLVPAFGEDPPTVPPRAIDGAGDGYVGAAVCKSCHAAEHAKWMLASHQLTFERVSDDNLPAEILGEGAAVHDPGRSTFRRIGDRFEVTTQGLSGGDETFTLSHVVGRMRVRMYVATMPDGRLQVLPGMLEEPTGEWFDYTHLLFSGAADFDTPPVVTPADGSFWTGPVRAWDGKCSRCHTSGRLQQVARTGEQGTRSIQRSLGIDCEMCHGPGQEHVAHFREKRAGPDPITRWSDLARDRQVSMCLRCHMESEVVDADFRLGADIFEHVTPTLIVSPDRIDPYGRPIELVYDGVPFSASRCASEGGLTCVSCHDPHGSDQPSQLKVSPDHDSMCVRCHDLDGDVRAHSHHAPARSGGTCVACHMPFLRIERGHGVIADHSIGIPRLGLEGDRVAQDACTWCHTNDLAAPGDAPAKTDAELRAAYVTWWPAAPPPHPWMQALAAARMDEPGAWKALGLIARDPGQARVVRASATRLLRRYVEQAPLLLLTLARDPDSLVRRSAMTALAGVPGVAVDQTLLAGLKDPSRAVQSAAAQAALEGWTRVSTCPEILAAVVPVLREDARTAPAFEDRWFRLGAALQIAKDYPGAIAAYERYIALEPSATAVGAQLERLRKKVAGD